jgi:hypothetical protein
MALVSMVTNTVGSTLGRMPHVDLPGRESQAWTTRNGVGAGAFHSTGSHPVEKRSAKMTPGTPNGASPPPARVSPTELSPRWVALGGRACCAGTFCPLLSAAAGPGDGLPGAQGSRGRLPECYRTIAEL